MFDRRRKGGWRLGALLRDLLGRRGRGVPRWQANGVIAVPSMADTDEDEPLALTTTERRALTRLLKRALDDIRFFGTAARSAEGDPRPARTAQAGAAAGADQAAGPRTGLWRR